MSKKKTLEDIFNDDELGILDLKPTPSNVKTEDERLIESFQEITAFYKKNNRKPETNNVTEFKLLARLKSLRQDVQKTKILKPYDTFDLLNKVEEVNSVNDILKDDDLGLLDTDETLSIFKLKNVPSTSERAETDFVAQRKPIKEREFMQYESMFKKIHMELREGKRKLVRYESADKNLKVGSYYLLNGMLLFFEKADLKTDNITLPTGDRLRKDGRTRIIFENGTLSNMLYRSLDKALLNKNNDGKIVSHTEDEVEKELFDNANSVNEEDVETGWIYILKSKSTNKEICSIKDLYKIGYTTIPLKERIKNAAKESTYLMAEVEVVNYYVCYNLNARKFENLVHRVFAESCLDVDVFDDKGRRFTPREWFVVPLTIIEKVLSLIRSGDILNYRYDSINQILIKG